MCGSIVWFIWRLSFSVFGGILRPRRASFPFGAHLCRFPTGGHCLGRGVSRRLLGRLVEQQGAAEAIPDRMKPTAICPRSSAERPLSVGTMVRKRGGVMAHIIEQAEKRQKKDREPCVADNLVVKDEHEEEERKKKRADKKPISESLDCKVARCVRDNFKGWSYHKTDFTIRNGMSLREKIRFDKERVAAGEKGVNFGKHYFSELRTLYGADTDPEQMIDVVDDSETIDPRLETALEGLFDRAKDYDSGIALLEHMDLCNQKTLVGLLRAALTVNPCATMSGNRFVMAVMRYIRRVGVIDKFPQEVKHMRKHFDMALQKSFLEYKKMELSALDWWNKHKTCATLVVPDEATEKCYACKTHWADVEEELRLVVESGDLGHLMFGRALQSIAAKKVDSLLEDSVQKLAKTKITPESMAAARQEIIGETKKLGFDAIDVHQTPKNITVKYRGVALKMSCASILDEWSTAVWALIKTVAVETKALDPLFCEDQLVSEAGPHYAGAEVDPALLADASGARKAATQAIASYKDVTAETLKQMFSKRGSFLCSIDRTFKLEQVFFEGVSGPKGEERYKMELLACLPSSGGEKTYAKSLAALSKLGDSMLAAWVGSCAKALHQMVATHVKGMQAGRPPKFDDAANASFVGLVKERLAFFLVTTTGSGDPPKTLVGKEAALALYRALETKQATSMDTVQLMDLQQVLQFAWLLDENNRINLEKWRNAVVSAAPDVHKNVRKASSNTGASKAQDKKKCVSSLFKKR